MLFQKRHRRVAVGQAAPDFSLPDQNGSLVALADYRGRSWVVLYFYPKDNTFGCIAESSDFRDHYAVFKDAGAEVIGVSSDTPASHADFSRRYKLPFRLLSDRGAKVRRAYGVPATFGIIPGRVTFVIDPEGTVRHVFNSQFDPASHVEQALGALHAPRPV